MSKLSSQNSVVILPCLEALRNLFDEAGIVLRRLFLDYEYTDSRDRVCVRTGGARRRGCTHHLARRGSSARREYLRVQGCTECARNFARVSLYRNPSRNRYWYGTRPTLRKTVADRALQMMDGDAVREIEARLRKCKKESPFWGTSYLPYVLSGWAGTGTACPPQSDECVYAKSGGVRRDDGIA